MGTTKSRKSRRNNSRPIAFSFLSNIALGSETNKPIDDNEGIAQIQSLTNYLDFSPCRSQAWQQRPTETDAGLYGNYVERFAGLPQQTGRELSELGAVSLHSSDSSLSVEDEHTQTPISGEACARVTSTTAQPVMTPSANPTTSHLPNTQIDQRKVGGKHDLRLKRQSSVYSHDGDVHHHKLTREDSERPIASEKIKRKSNNAEKGDHSGSGIMSVFRYYTDKIRQSAGRKTIDQNVNRGYVQQQLDNSKRRTALSYAHFLSPLGSLEDDTTVEQSLDKHAYDPYFLDNDSYAKLCAVSSSLGTSSGQNVRPSDIKRELNEQFRLAHPELAPEITLSKIRSIKSHLLDIGKAADLEVSSVAHAFVYFEKLVVKNVVTKKNRKLIAACCIFLATKVNEAKRAWFPRLLEAIDDELDEDAEEVHGHEFAVFADLEFDLYIPRREFMPHFERIFSELEYKSIQEYLGHSTFYEVSRHV
ncbi:CDK5 and ABL1 enzyme substrate 1 [Apophysomyces sp. BC1034]|nr:CDK5 and ABL1 enzyme substrate 1 [Apophysomyces sp. BC1015]KAG0178953.1 CDK5 and ABL1 enzyme substrate 1 [Apophysomyces sp. BC1021]KAG0189427.1 CDK5 and ABL1 enzyme substrate 1 [Apophysomyces sp. BC1034]